MMTVALVLFLPQLYSSSHNNQKRVVVAENDTVIIGMYPSSETMLSINEVVLNGDDYHNCYVLVVPVSTLNYHWQTITDSYNTTTIVDRLPIVNYMYVYLLSGSTVTMDICLGNVSNSPIATLYGFDNETAFVEYNEYLSANNPVYTIALNVGSSGNLICTNTTFTAQSSKYYFFILLAPLKGTTYSVKTVVSQKYINYREYISNYSLCVVASGHNCSVSLSINNQVVNNDVVVLAYTKPNYSLSSKINHLDITMQGEQNTVHMSVLVCWFMIGLGASLFILCGVFILVMLYLYIQRKRMARVKKYIRISTNVN